MIKFEYDPVLGCVNWTFTPPKNIISLTSKKRNKNDQQREEQNPKRSS